jgi:exonuclease SbcD
MIRLAHVADIHLGARLRGLPDYPGCPEIDPVESAYDAFAALLDRILTGGYDGVLLAGDLFDRNEVTARARSVAEAALADLHDAGIPVALIWGNHDAESPLPAQLRLPPTTWLAGPQTPSTRFWDHAGLAIHAQSIADPDEGRDLAAGYPDAVPGLRNIGVLHTSLTGVHSRRTCAPTTVETLAARRYDYWALGHVHQRRTIAADPLAAYSGSGHAAREHEFGPHGYLEVSGTSTMSIVPVDTAPVIRETLVAATQADIQNCFASYPDTNAIVVWTLRGPRSLLGPAREAARCHPGFAVIGD